MAFSLRCKSPGATKAARCLWMHDRDLYHRLFSETRAKKFAMLGTDGPYERIMTSAALRYPPGLIVLPCLTIPAPVAFFFTLFSLKKTIRAGSQSIGDEKKKRTNFIY